MFQRINFSEDHFLVLGKMVSVGKVFSRTHAKKEGRKKEGKGRERKEQLVVAHTHNSQH